MMGRQKKDRNHFPPIINWYRNQRKMKKNGSPDPECNETKINYDKESNEAHRNTLQEEIWQVINENFIEMIPDMVNQNVQETLKKYQDNKNRDFEKAQEQIKETIEALYKHESETKNTINKEINEFRTKIDTIKEVETHDVEKPQKKEQNRNAKRNGRPIQQTRTSRRQNLRT
jgi:hypothetical protein